VAGVLTTHGSAAVDHHPAAQDSPIVEVLRRAGTISLGKTQVPEFGLTSYSENRIAPPARNPLDPALSPGGSSGGSAAAVAAHLLPFAPGSDGGGSIRIPAAATGLVGLKPGRGTVPAGSGTDAGRLVVAGPLARTAADAALLLEAMADGTGSDDGGRPASYLAAAQHAEGPEGFRRLRIGVSTNSPFAAAYAIALEPAARAALDAGIRALTGLGHDVVEADLRYDNRYPAAFGAVWTSGLAEARIPPDRETRLMPLTRTFRNRALARPAAVLQEALDVLRKFQADTITQYSAYDLVLTPAMAMTPRPVGWYTSVEPDIDYMRQCQYSPFSSLVNVCGLPAIAVTTHWTGAGLPMGIQLIGLPGAEARLLAVAAQLEDGLLHSETQDT
jgi:amidase